MPALEYPDSATITSWELRSRGIRDGSSPVEAYEVNSTTWRGKVLCKYEYRHDVAEWLLGKSALTGGSGTGLSRLLPRAVHPDKPRIRWTKVTNMVPVVFTEDDDSGDIPLAKGTYADIELLGEFLPFPVREDDDTTDEIQRFVSYPENIDASGEFLQLPGGSGGGLAYIAPGVVGVHLKAIPTNQFATVTVQEQFEVTIHDLPEDAWEPGSILWNRIYGVDEYEESALPYMGTINADEDGFLGRPPGTVLFLRPIPRRQVNSRGEGWSWTISYQFVFRAAGWNWLWNHDPDPAKSGYFWVGRSTLTTIETADALTDFHSLYNARPFADLFKFT